MMKPFLTNTLITLITLLFAAPSKADIIIEARDAGTYEMTWQGVTLKADIVSTYDNVFEASLTIGTGENALSFDAVESYLNAPSIRMVELDPTNSTPEILVMAYTGGAHCCHEIIALSNIDDTGWERVDIGTFDASSVPTEFIDMDGDGSVEFNASDDRFLYQFASYAESFAPPLILSLRGFEVVDRTQEAAFQNYIETALSNMGTAPESGPARNSWLASYAAILLMLKQDDPLDFATSSYDPEVEWGVMQCKDPEKNEETCAKDQWINIGFEAALIDFLSETGHLEPAQ